MADRKTDYALLREVDCPPFQGNLAFLLENRSLTKQTNRAYRDQLLCVNYKRLTHQQAMTSSLTYTIDLLLT